MSFWKGLAAHVRSILRPGDAEARLDEEFRFHLETETEHLIRQGVPPAEARRRARLAFGAVEGYRETMRDERGARWFDDLRADVRYAIRGMRRHPGFMVAATLTLGLGIGVNGIVFGYINSILFRPVPAQVPEELAALFTRDTTTGNTGALGYDDFVDFRDRSGAFAGLAAMAGAPVNLVVPETGGNATGDMVWAEVVTEDFFSVLGTRPGCRPLLYRRRCAAGRQSVRRPQLPRLATPISRGSECRRPRRPHQRHGVRRDRRGATWIQRDASAGILARGMGSDRYAAGRAARHARAAARTRWRSAARVRTTPAWLRSRTDAGRSRRLRETTRSGVSRVEQECRHESAAGEGRL